MSEAERLKAVKLLAARRKFSLSLVERYSRIITKAIAQKREKSE